MSAKPYIEWAAKDLTASKCFFKTVFGWEFTDYGDEYTAFKGQELEGGFYLHPEQCSRTQSGGALLVLHCDDLEACQAKVKQAGGKISREIFSFPGGRRFHFLEPSGNELAVWSEQTA